MMLQSLTSTPTDTASHKSLAVPCRVHRAWLRYMQVDKAAKENGLHVYITVVAPVKGAGAAARYDAAPDSVDFSAKKYASASSIQTAGHGHFSLVIQHCTGAATRDIFFKPTMSNCVTAGANTAVRNMIKNSEVRVPLSMFCDSEEGALWAGCASGVTWS